MQSGPFSYSRNPIYLSMASIQFGLELAFQSLWIIAMILPAVLVIRYGVIARKERYMEKKFGEEYRQYMEFVRKWIYVR